MRKVIERFLLNISIIFLAISICIWAAPKLMKSQDYRCKTTFGNNYQFSLKETFSRTKTSCINKETKELKTI